MPLVWVLHFYHLTITSVRVGGFHPVHPSAVDGYVSLPQQDYNEPPHQNPFAVGIKHRPHQPTLGLNDDYGAGYIANLV